VEEVDQVFSKMRHVTSLEKRVARRKLLKIVSGQSSLYKATIARSGISVVAYLLIVRQARLWTETPTIAVGIAILFLRGTTAAWPMLYCFFILGSITVAVTGTRTFQFAKHRRSLKILKV